MRILLILLFVSNLAISQNSLNGEWIGEIKSLQGTISLSFKINTNPLAGTLSSSLGLSGVKLEDITFKDKQLSFKISSFAVSYEGVVNEKEINGVWSQAGKKVDLKLSKKKRKL